MDAVPTEMDDQMSEYNLNDESRVTPAMISAGVAVLEAFQDEVTKPTLADLVYRAMAEAKSLENDGETPNHMQIEPT